MKVHVIWYKDADGVHQIHGVCFSEEIAKEVIKGLGLYSKDAHYETEDLLDEPPAAEKSTLLENLRAKAKKARAEAGMAEVSYAVSMAEAAAGNGCNKIEFPTTQRLPAVREAVKEHFEDAGCKVTDTGTKLVIDWSGK